MNPEKTLYNRHALMEEVRPYPWDAPRACDFPRHSGFYVFDLAFAFAKTRQQAFLGQLQRFLDYWWEKRNEAGLFLIESHSPPHELEYYNVKAPGQTLSLGTLHDARGGTFILFSTDKEPTTMLLWGGCYGVPPATSAALTALCAYRLTNDERLLAWAQAAEEQALTTPFPADATVPAMDAGAPRRPLRPHRGDAVVGGGLVAGGDGFGLVSLSRPAQGCEWHPLVRVADGAELLAARPPRVALLSRDGASRPLLADYTAH